MIAQCSSRWTRWFAAFVVVLFLGAGAPAQQTLGSVNGTVLDASGAAVSGATVVVSDTSIGVTRTVQAGKDGYFQVFNLPIGTYTVTGSEQGFKTTHVSGIRVLEAQAATVKVTLDVGQVSTSVTVEANPMLNATDTTNGYTLESAQIQETPLATGSFTQLAVLAPGVNAELLSGIDTNAGLGNQPIWANGQRDTSNTFQVNGVDVTNLFNGKSSSSTSSQRYNFNIGAGGSSTSQYGSGTIGGANQTGSSVYGSNGNSLPTPPPAFLQELRVNTSMYDAQQGRTSGAQIDANTISGTNSFHGQMYGTFADNGLNADPFFFKQQAELATEGVGAFPGYLADPALHRWTTGAAVGGPIKKDKLFFFVGYQHLYASDQSTGLSQFNVPTALTDDRSMAGLEATATAWQNNNKPYTGAISQQAFDLLNAKVGGQYLIPSAQSSAPYAYGVPNVTLVGTSIQLGDQAAGSLDYDVNSKDRLSGKYYYQNDPLTKPFGYSATVGFPTKTANGAQVGVLDNTILLGPKINWEQRVGFARMYTYSYYQQTVTDTTTPGAGGSFGIGSGTTPGYLTGGVLPGMFISEFAVNSAATPTTLKLGPGSAFADTGYFQNRLNPSSNLILSLGKHTIFAGGGYSYSQLNIRNNRGGLPQVTASSFANFLGGVNNHAYLLDTTDPSSGKNDADRYYRTNEIDSYVQDKWQLLSNLSITAGVRYDYHGGLTEKFGNIFNFDSSAYNVTGTDTTGFAVVNSGFVVAGNNAHDPSAGVSDSTLSGRQWGISPRVGFAFSPKMGNNKVVFRGGFGLYFDRGELFSYLSPPAGSSVGGPFGVTEEAPLVSYVSAGKNTFANPFGKSLPLSSSTNPPLPSANPAVMVTALQNQLNTMTGSTSDYGLNCGAVNSQEAGDCTTPLDFGAYDRNNVLPYTMNFTFNMEWQPRPDLAVTIGYTGNRGRHAVIPIPFNEPQMASSTSPAMVLGASPHSGGETTNYGIQVLRDTAIDADGDLPSIGSEPWSTYDGGNTDFRAPYVGYSPYAALFETVGNSAYDALETHLQKALSHHVQAGASYTWGHSLDEQSDLGIFFTGNDPLHIRNSYASSDYDRRHVFSANFLALLPNPARDHSLLSYATNGWQLTGIAILQSGEPYSLYEYHGAVASAALGYYPSLINPILPVKDPHNIQQEMTGQSGKLRGVGGAFMPAIDPDQVAIQYLAPGEKGVPSATSPGADPTDPLDVYETDYAPDNQRNIFRQATQKRLDISVHKDFHLTEKLNLQYAFNVFNLTNTTSLDVPQNQTEIRQESACDNEINGSNYNCSHGYLYGQVATSQLDQSMSASGGAPGGGTAGANFDELPYVTRNGRSVMAPTTLPEGVNGCVASKTVATGVCANNGANFGSVTGVIGSARIINMELHLTF